MTEVKKEYTSGGVSFTTLLTILFIALKLTGYIAWAWVWVLFPLWLPLVLALGFCTLALVVVATVSIFGQWSTESKLKKKSKK